MKLIEYPTEKEWLEAKKTKIGGTDASAILGENKFKTNIQAYRQFKGIETAEDISGKKCVADGKALESIIAMAWNIDNSEKYSLQQMDNTLALHDDIDYVAGSFDGIITAIETGKKLIWECKTTTFHSFAMTKAWKDCIPQMYYIQVLFYLWISGYTEAILTARAYHKYAQKPFYTTTDYRIERNENDIEILESEITKYWEENIQKNIEPSGLMPSL